MRKRSCGERQWVICTGQRALMIAGIVLVAAGLIVLLLCIPAWAWAALLGVALAIAICLHLFDSGVHSFHLA